MGLFGGGNSSSVFSPDQRQWVDSYNVSASPTAALSDIGKVTINLPAPPVSDKIAAAVKSMDPRWMMTFGVIALAAVLWKVFK